VFESSVFEEIIERAAKEADDIAIGGSGNIGARRHRFRVK
jgi:hypothetical protein